MRNKSYLSENPWRKKFIYNEQLFGVEFAMTVNCIRYRNMIMEFLRNSTGRHAILAKTAFSFYTMRAKIDLLQQRFPDSNIGWNSNVNWPTRLCDVSWMSLGGKDSFSIYYLFINYSYNTITNYILIIIIIYINYILIAHVLKKIFISWNTCYVLEGH